MIFSAGEGARKHGGAQSLVLSYLSEARATLFLSIQTLIPQPTQTIIFSRKVAENQKLTEGHHLMTQIKARDEKDFPD